ncbi:MAG: KpsF/GutQ family sugar-phosphate isomerase [Pseudomonadota bacterium]
MSQANIKRIAQEVIQIEKQGIETLVSRIDDNFQEACEIILACKGRVVVTGMGKSGHIGSKLAATLASTGTPAFFVHPGEASHGDLGMITSHDIVVALSNSGETSEVITLLPVIKRLNVKLIAMVGDIHSTLAKQSNVTLNVHVEQEACPLDLAPTASTTAALVMGDALAITLLNLRGFTADDFALSHPGGSLGKRLLLTVDDLMHSGNDLPKVETSTTISDALVEMTNKRLGMTTVLRGNQVVGVFTDGDLRRTLEKPIDIKTSMIGSVMTKGFKTIISGSLASEAVKIMETYRINAIAVTDLSQNVIGVLSMHDLLQAGVV